MRLTLDEYSKHFKMSKEMINSKLRTKKLNYIIENSITYIIVPKSSVDNDKIGEINTQKEKSLQVKAQTPAPLKKTKTTVAMVLGLYQKENQQLKEKILMLEAKIDKLIDDKEQMLRDEMSKIEQVYSNKDEQLKNILELINAKLTQENSGTIHEVQTVPSSPSLQKQNVTAPKEESLIELKSYLKETDLQTYQKKIIKKRFLAVQDEDVRVIIKDSKIYLNFSKYDYSDLLEY
ncbi:MAG: hypothetical protein U9N39_07295 [Campylobacterota bacterium]|nr:hypothetical protein [Campylobacterota bacterium]